MHLISWLEILLTVFCCFVVCGAGVPASDGGQPQPEEQRGAGSESDTACSDGFLPTGVTAPATSPAAYCTAQ